MRHKGLILLLITIFLFAIVLVWYFDLFNKSVEPIDSLKGKNYNYARTKYFKKEADNHYTINVNHILNEFDGGILTNKKILSDSIVHVYTWYYFTHKKTIWVGTTAKMNNQILDAIRYKNSVQF
jgi:hypothetical protein